MSLPLYLVALLVGCAHRADVPSMAIGIEPGEVYEPSLNPNAAPPPVEAPATAFGVVHFGFDSAALRSADAAVLEANLAVLQANPTLSILVEGHCDERGSAAYNLTLGQRRADAVKRWLVSHGVAPERIRSSSLGESAPSDPGHHEAAWAENRRVTTVVAAMPNA